MHGAQPDPSNQVANEYWLRHNIHWVWRCGSPTAWRRHFRPVLGDQLVETQPAAAPQLKAGDFPTSPASRLGHRSIVRSSSAKRALINYFPIKPAARPQGGS
jgi:hypothetical protein